MSGKTKRGLRGRMIPEKLVSTLRQADHCVLVTHVRPDGDALGSLFGLADILRSCGKKVFCFLDEPLSPVWDFLPGCGRAETELSALHRFVAAAGDEYIVISLDCGSADRLGKYRDELLALQPFCVIDHHAGHQKYGGLLWLEPHCSSTGEMIHGLASELGVKLSLEAALNLYVAICTDTGSFRYDSTSPATMRIAADLLERGVNPAEVAARVYDNYSLQRLQLLERVLATLQLYESQRLAMIHVTQEMFHETGGNEDDLDGFINFPRSLASVEVAVFCKEGKDGVISMSLRAKGGCDVARIAAVFGGGGHRNAAGCRFFDCSLEEARDRVLVQLAEALTGDGRHR